MTAELDEISFFFPLIKPWRVEVFPLLERKFELLDEAVGVKLEYHYEGTRVEVGFSKIDVRSDVESVISEAEWATWPEISWGYSAYAKITFKSIYPGDEFVRGVVDNYPEGIEPRDLWVDFLRWRAESEIFVIQIASHLAYPGGAISGASVCEVNGKLSIFKGRHSPLTESYVYAMELGKPQLARIPLDAVWAWLAKRNGLRFGGVGDTPAAKALCYLTHVFDEDFHGQRFLGAVWACAGLEAFYGEDQSARAAQLSQKIPAFLGVDEEVCRKDVQSIYKLRSSIIHGNKAISSAVAGSDGIPDKHHDEEYDAKSFGIYYLNETLRACVMRDVDAAKFSTVWREGSEASTH